MYRTDPSGAVTIEFAYPYNAAFVQAHKAGCKAARRRNKGVETEVRPMPGYTMETIEDMLANPDEGHVVVHQCLRNN